MNTIDEIITDNASENTHLRKLAGHLSDENLRLPLEAGWTVAAVLAHLAIPPRQAAELAVRLADEVDKIIADLTPEMVEAIQTRGTTVKLRRADHRRTHLGEIEKVLEGRYR